MKIKAPILRETIRLAKKKNKPLQHPEWGHYHHFSFVIWDGKILTWATNKKDDPDQTFYGYSETNKTHSEYCAALKVLDRDSGKLAIVNIRLNKQNEIRNSKPCKKCVQYLTDLGITTIYYTTSEGEFKKYEY